MDEDLRELERAAANGDEDAAHELFVREARGMGADALAGLASQVVRLRRMFFAFALRSPDLNPAAAYDESVTWADRFQVLRETEPPLPADLPWPPIGVEGPEGRPGPPGEDGGTFQLRPHFGSGGVPATIGPGKAISFAGAQLFDMGDVVEVRLAGTDRCSYQGCESEPDRERCGGQDWRSTGGCGHYYCLTHLIHDFANNVYAPFCPDCHGMIRS